jgi:hypothetical protein
MYRIEDKAAAIKEVQRYLSSLIDSVHIAENGSYDANTREAVVRFQNMRGLAPIGTVDYQTFSLLYEAFRENQLKNAVRETSIGYRSFPITRDSTPEEIKSVNSKIQEILKYYGAEITQHTFSVFNAEVEESIMILREIFRLEGEAVIDEILFWRIVREHSSIKKALKKS